MPESSTETSSNIAIVGAGPRGLSALESLLKFWSDGELQVLLFEKTQYLGHGPIYALEQPDANWLNVSERFLVLPAREPQTACGKKFEGFPSYQDWAGWKSQDPDTADEYPLRSKLGRYLKERFESLRKPLEAAGILKICRERVIELALLEGKVRIETESGDTQTADHVLLTIGHQPTELDQQLKSWLEVARKSPPLSCFTSPYPDNSFKSLELEQSATVAVRGFGLAAIDVVRRFGELSGGRFVRQDSRLVYHPSQSGPAAIVPFTLDGLPPVAKPLNQSIDAMYEPTQSQLDELEARLSDRELQAKADGESFLIDGIAPIAAEVYSKIHEDSTMTGTWTKVVGEWLRDERVEHECLTSTKQDLATTLAEQIKMSRGLAPPSLDYSTGQVWRHCHPVIYRTLSHSHCSDETLAKIILLDERMKRFAFGPPLESIEQLYAAHEAGWLLLDWLDDPDITLSDRGWQLSKNSDISCKIMVNSVLDSPQLLKVSSDLVRSLLQDELLNPVHDKLGVVTDSNGYLMSGDGRKVPVALLGRLAKGTVVGVDAILECFGENPKRWAEATANQFAR